MDEDGQLLWREARAGDELPASTDRTTRRLDGSDTSNHQCRRLSNLLVNAAGGVADFGECSLDKLWIGFDSRAADELNQLPPAHRSVMRIGGWLSQHRPQAIIEAHRPYSRKLVTGNFPRARSIGTAGLRKLPPVNYPETGQESAR